MKKNITVIFLMLIFYAVSAFAEFSAVEVYEKRSGAVVVIVAAPEGKIRKVGAGSIISAGGYIITNAHVVIDKAGAIPCRDIRVYLKPERVTGNSDRDLKKAYRAVVVAYDIPLDLALLKVKGLPRDTGHLEFADPREIRTGEEVVTIGHPEQGGFWTLTYGRISGEIFNQNGIEGKDVFQTDASINRGNSGGPLLDRRGYLVGINTNIARIGAGNLPITGVNFAVKSSVVRKWLAGQGIRIAYGKKPLERDVPAATGKSGKTSDKTVIKEKVPQDRILTPKRPYKIESLFKETENDLEEMMKEMRGKIRN